VNVVAWAYTLTIFFVNFLNSSWKSLKRNQIKLINLLIHQEMCNFFSLKKVIFEPKKIGQIVA